MRVLDSYNTDTMGKKRHKIHKKDLDRTRCDSSDDSSCNVSGKKMTGASSVDKKDDKTKNDLLSNLPSVKGLANLGNTCFFNAVLQVLNQTEDLENIVSNNCKKGAELYLPRIKEDDEKFSDEDDSESEMTSNLLPLTLTLSDGGALAQALGTVLKDMKTTRNGSISPSNLFRQVCKKTPQFKGFQQQDSHELLRHLLDGMKIEEIRRAQAAILKHFNLPQNVNPKNVAEDLKPKLKVFGRLAKNYTFVDKLFGGYTISTVVCEECNTASHIFEPFLDLSLPISEEKPMRSTTMRKQESDSPVSVTKNDKVEEKYAAPISKHKEKMLRKNAKKEQKLARRRARNHSQSEAVKDHDECEDDDTVKNDENDTNIDNKIEDDTTHDNKDDNIERNDGDKNHDVEDDDDDDDDADEMSDPEHEATGFADVEDNTESDTSHIVNTLGGDSALVGTLTQNTFEENTNCSQEDKTVDADCNSFDSQLNSLPQFSENSKADTLCKQTINSQSVDDGNDSVKAKNDEVELSEKLSDLKIADNSYSGSSSAFCNGDVHSDKRDNKDTSELGSDDKVGVQSVENSLDEDGVDSNVVPENNGAQYEEVDDKVLYSGDEEQEREINTEHTDAHLLGGAVTKTYNSLHSPAVLEKFDNKKRAKPNSKQEAIKMSMVTLAPRLQSSGSDCTVESCLRQFTSPELLTGGNKFGCEECTRDKYPDKNQKGYQKVYTNASKQILLYNLPPVLTLHLKRFQQVGFSLRKVNRHVNFPLVMDVAPYCSLMAQGVNHKQVLYGLYGVVEHSGRLSGGHYTAYVKVRPKSERAKLYSQRTLKIKLSVPKKMETEKSSQNEDCKFGCSENVSLGRWFHISDTSVREVTENHVLKCQAYLLFYERLL